MANVTSATNVTTTLIASITTTLTLPSNSTHINVTDGSINSAATNVTNSSSPSPDPGVAASEDVGAMIIAVVLTMIAGFGLAFNILIFVIFARVRSGRKRVFYFVLELAVFDCIAICLWTVFSLVQLGGVSVGDVCHVQAYVMAIVLLVGLYTMFVMNFERCVKLVKPSKHYEIFGGNKTVTLVIMLTVFLYCLTITIFPLLGFGSIALFKNQYQCSWNFEESFSHQIFLFVVGCILPFVGSVICQVICVLKAKKISAQVRPGETTILEENKDVPKITYAEKLKKMENKFKFSQQKKNVIKKRHRKRSNDSSSDSSDSDSDSGENRQKKKQKRHYKFRHDDFKLAVTFIILTVLEFICWLPYFVVGFIWVVPGYSTVHDAVFGVVICLCHFTTLLKPLVYLTNARLRSMAWELFTTKRKSDEDGDTYRNHPSQHRDVNRVKNSSDYDESRSHSRRSSVSSHGKSSNSKGREDRD